MLSHDRREALLMELRDKKTVRIADAAREFHIGEATIRRDLEKLEKRGLARRIYGGAVLAEGLETEIPMIVREKTEQVQKDIIGRLAAKLVMDGDVLILDSSSSVLSMIPHLSARKDLTIMTNGLKTAGVAGELRSAKVYCCGGRLRELSSSLVGMTARQFIRTHSAHKLFFSCRSVHPDKGLCDSSEEEAELRQDMMAASDRSILLADHTKLDTGAFCEICDIGSIDTLITDTEPPYEWQEKLKGYGTRLIFP